MSIRQGNNTIAGSGYTKSEVDTLLAGKANNSDVVHLAGTETITGSKTFTTPVEISVSGNFANGVVYKNSILPNNYTNPSSQANLLPYVIQGTNGDYIAWVGGNKYTDGTTAVGLSVRRRSSSSDADHDVSLQLLIDSSNNGSLLAPASSKLGSVITTTSLTKADVGAIKLGNGIIINWGICDSNATTTFALPFTENNYAILVTPQAESAGVTCIRSNRTTTQFTCITTSHTNRFIAIGY